MALNTSDIEQSIEILHNEPDLHRRVFVALAADELVALRQALEEPLAFLTAAPHELTCAVNKHNHSQADGAATGRLASVPDKEVYLVMEVFFAGDTADVARARRRADLMRKVGLECLAGGTGAH